MESIVLQSAELRRLVEVFVFLWFFYLAYYEAGNYAGRKHNFDVFNLETFVCFRSVGYTARSNCLSYSVMDLRGEMFRNLLPNEAVNWSLKLLVFMRRNKKSREMSSSWSASLLDQIWSWESIWTLHWNITFRTFSPSG